MERNKYISEVKRNKYQDFDFILYLNNKPIVQRWFEIDGFNEDSLDSIELRDLLNELIGDYGIISEKIKKDTVNFLWNNFNPFKEQSQEDVDNLRVKNNKVKLAITYKKRPFLEGVIDGNMLPIGDYTYIGDKQVWYQIDIKNEITPIIRTIRDYLTRDSYTKAL